MGTFSNKNGVYCSAGNMRMSTCANVTSKYLETISCNTRYTHVLHVGEFLWFTGKPQYFCHNIEPMMSKWGQQCSPMQIIDRTVSPRKPGDKVVLLRAKYRIFWMNNKAIIESSFRRIWRILQISEVVIRPRWITPS